MIERASREPRNTVSYPYLCLIAASVNLSSRAVAGRRVSDASGVLHPMRSAGGAAKIHSDHPERGGATTKLGNALL